MTLPNPTSVRLSEHFHESQNLATPWPHTFNLQSWEVQGCTMAPRHCGFRASHSETFALEHACKHKAEAAIRLVQPPSRDSALGVGDESGGIPPRGGRSRALNWGRAGRVWPPHLHNSACVSAPAQIAQSTTAHDCAWCCTFALPFGDWVGGVFRQFELAVSLQACMGQLFGRAPPVVISNAYIVWY